MPNTIGIVASHYKTTDPVLALHLDASVPSSIIYNTTTNLVSEWRDISGFNRHFSNPGTDKPQYSSTEKGILFNSTKLICSDTDVSWKNDDSMTIFAVVRRTDSNTTRREFFGDRPASGSSDGGRVLGHDTSGSTTLVGKYSHIRYANALTNNMTAAMGVQKHLLTATSGYPYSLSIRLNNDPTVTIITTGRRDSNERFLLGYGSYAFSYGFRGHVYELRCYINAPFIENNLMNSIKDSLIAKWGIS